MNARNAFLLATAPIAIATALIFNGNDGTMGIEAHANEPATPKTELTAPEENPFTLNDTPEDTLESQPDEVAGLLEEVLSRAMLSTPTQQSEDGTEILTLEDPQQTLEKAMSELEPSNAQSPRLQSMFSSCLESGFSDMQADYEAQRSHLYINVDATEMLTIAKRMQVYLDENDIQHMSYISASLGATNEVGKDRINFTIVSEFHANDFNQFLGDSSTQINIYHDEASDSFSIEVTPSPSNIDVTGVEAIKDPERLQRHMESFNKIVSKRMHLRLADRLPEFMSCLYDTRIDNNPELKERVVTSIAQLEEVANTGKTLEMNLGWD